MTNSPEQWLQAHAACPLPILKQSREYFRSQQDTSSVNISRLWKILEKDPGLCLNFLILAAKSKKTRVSSVQHAMRMLGMPRVLSLPDELPLLEDIDDSMTRQLILASHARAFHTSRQYLDWVRLLHDSTVEDTATAAILSGLADYLICCYTPDKAEQIYRHQAGVDQTLESATEQVLGFTHRDVAQTAATTWALPELVYQTIQPAPDSELRTRLITLADALCREVAKGWYTRATNNLVETIAGLLLLPREELTRRIHATAARTARESCSVYHDITPAAASMIFIRTSQESPTRVVRLAPTPSRGLILKSSLARIRQDKHTNYTKILSHAFKAMSRGLALTRVFFAVLERDKQSLFIKYVISKGEKNTLKGTRLYLHEHRLLEKLISKPGSLWLHAENCSRYRQLLSQPLRSTLVLDNCLMMSIYVNDKAIGMFYADRCNERPLDARHYRYFKLVCRETSHALGAVLEESGRKRIVNE